MTSPRASLVLLNYNGWELLNAALPSAVGQEFDGCEVVVVDNGSTDGSVSKLRESWPQVRVVALPRNQGVTAALNAMMRAAQGDYVALLNNDVELLPDWLAVLVEALDREPRAAAAAGKLLRMGARDVIDRAGDELQWSSACHGRGAGERDIGQYDAPGEVFSVGGAAAVYRRAAFERVGPFDEEFFAYLEDVDWGFRARLAGYVALYHPGAVGFHRGGATLGEVNEFSLYHLRRNQVWLVVKNFPATSLVRHAPAILLFNAVQLALSVRRGNLPVVARAYRDALVGLPAMVRKRRAVQSRRQIDPARLEFLIAPSARPW